MKTWLTQWRISNALNDRPALAPPALQPLARSVEMRRFARQAASLDAALRKGPPDSGTPAGLHDDIMRAIQRSGAVNTRSRREFPLRLAPLSALGMLILLGIFAVVHFSRPNVIAPLPGGSSSLTIASTTLETGGAWIATASSAALSPLHEEMTSLDRDLAGVQEHLLASVP